MNLFNYIKTVFLFFFKLQLKSRKTKLFLLIAFIPSVIITIVNIIGKNGENIDQNFFEKIALMFFFAFYIQVVSLFFGSTVINDEIDDKTLIYLTTKPIPKSSIIIGKFIANYIISVVIIQIGLFASYFLTTKNNTTTTAELFQYSGTVFIAILAYMSFFLLFGTILKKPIFMGLVYSFGLEPFTKLIGGTIQEISFVFYLNKFMPGNLFEYKTLPPTVFYAGTILLITAFIFIAISTATFAKKEYILTDSA